MTYIKPDVPDVTPEAGAWLAVHHLQLACAYFEAAEAAAVRANIEEAFVDGDGQPSIWINGARAFWVAMKVAYDKVDMDR